MPTLDFTCPACGREMHPNAAACKHCGTRKESGSKPVRKKSAGPMRTWAHDEIYDGIDVPGEGGRDNDFDYDDFVKREFGVDREGRRLSRWERLRRFKPPGGISLFWWIVAIVALLAFVLTWVL